jgi:hypothetical protein
MKKRSFYFLIFIAMMIMARGLAQDTIFMKNNQIIPANVMEVSTTEVRYKRYDMNEGPVYVEKKSMI